MPERASLPVVIVTSRDERGGPPSAASRRGRTPTWSSASFDQQALLETVERLIGGEAVTRTRVLICEDSPTYASALRARSSTTRDSRSSASAASAEEAIALVPRLSPTS